jgi:hypothetical protein
VRSFLLSGVALAMLAGPAIAAEVIAPDSTIAGYSQETLGNQWWAWVAKTPASINPLYGDPTGANAGVNNYGPVFFLAGTGSPGFATRSFKVPSGKPLFFPLTNFVDFESDVIPGNCPTDYGCATGYLISPDQLAGVNPGEQLVATLNGSPLTLNGTPITSEIAPFFQLTGQNPGAGHDELYPYTLAATDNILLGYGYPNGSTGGLVQEGYWVGLGPLPPGEYTLEFGALDSNGSGLFGAIDHLTVMAPEPSTWAMMLVGFAGLGLAGYRSRRMATRRAIAA